jgi:membrane-associated phospholipid phosphatase
MDTAVLPAYHDGDHGDDRGGDDRGGARPGHRGGERARARRLAAWLIVLAVLAIGTAGACYVFFVRTPTGQRFDNAALLGSYQQYSVTRAADNASLQRITADSFALVLVVLVAIGILRRRVLLGLAAAFTAGITVVGVDVLKHDVLTRPALVSTDYSITANSFPSGHTATAVACALALMLVSPPRWRGLVAVVAGFYAWGVAAQVQTAGWHRPSDAVGAALLAGAVVALVGAAFLLWRPTATSWSRPHRIALAILGLVALGSGAATVVGLTKVVRWLHNHQASVASTSAIRNDAYLTGVSATVVVVVVILAVLLILLGHVDLDHRPGRVWRAGEAPGAAGSSRHTWG